MNWDSVVIHSLAPPETPAQYELARATYHLLIEWVQISRPGRNIEGRWKIVNGRRFPHKGVSRGRPVEGGPIHICVLANLATGAPAFYAALLRRCGHLVKNLIKKHEISTNRIVGHDDVSSVLGDGWPCRRSLGCPGQHLPIRRLRLDIEREIALESDRAAARRTQVWHAPGAEPK